MKIVKPGDTTVSNKGNMSDKRVSDKILTALNEQIKVEGTASITYRALAEWCEYTGYTGSSSFFRNHADEELSHMKKVVEYIQDRDELPQMPAVPAPIKLTFSTLIEAFNFAYEHEKKVTSTYSSLADLCFSEKDFMTFEFSLSFLKEQKEEESKIKTKIDRLMLVEGDKAGILVFDKELN